MSLPRESSSTAYALLAGMVMLTACGSESLPPVPQARLSLRDGVSRAESLSVQGKLAMSSVAGPAALLTAGSCTIRYGEPGQISGCTAPVPQVVPSSPWLQHSGGIYEPPQTAPIKIRFAGDVHGITMQSAGALKCSGSSIGAMVGYRNGVQVVQASNWLTNPSDCGADDVTFGVTGQFPLNVVIDSLVILGVDPWTFDVFGQQGRARLDYTVTFTPGPGISVSCLPSSVERGAQVTVTCTASPPPGATSVTVSEWRFETPLLSSPITEQSSSTTWTGPAATSGQVTVTGTLDGNPDNGQGSITVTARNWTSKTVRYQVLEKDQAGVLPTLPDTVGDLGKAANIAGIFPLPGQATQITTGPQNGVWYWNDTPAQGETWIYINRIALALNSAFYNLQPTHGPASKCKQNQVLPFIPVVEAHEGLHLELNSHAETFKRKLNELVPQVTEPVVSLGFELDLVDQTTIATQSVIAQAQLIADDVSQGGTVPPAQYPCTFKYF